VTARGGSKRLPGKNLRLLGGRPLITWSIAAGLNIPETADVLVSTDDAEIARVALLAGALVPWLRPTELATDEATSVDVSLHALDWYEERHGPVDGLLLLQPTSPYRTPESIRRGIASFGENGQRPVVGVSPARPHPALCFRIERDQLVPFVDTATFGTRSQDFPPAYAVNGAFYLIAAGELRATRSFFGRGATPLIMTMPAEAIDIDTEEDWMIAEAMLPHVTNVPPATS
jgi:CMP-N,N'-diacetyllegionaminic acid synthase